MPKKIGAAWDTLPCALCKRELKRRTDKNEKPYFVCDDCGTQFFVRRSAGIERLEALLSAPQLKPDALKIPSRIAAGVSVELDALDAASEFLDVEELGEPGSGDPPTYLPIPEWILARTARVRSLLNLK